MNKLANILIASLALCGLTTHDARAETVGTVEEGSARAWMIGIAPRFGVTIPTSELESFVVGGLEIDYVLPVLDGHLAAYGDFSITQTDRSERVFDSRINGEGEYELDTTQFKIALGGVYRIFGFEKRLVPYAGAGAIMQTLKTTETTDFAPGENQAQDTAFGFEVLGGVDFRLGPGFILGEVRFSYTDLDHLWTGDSNAGNVAISAGYRIVL